MRNEERIRNGCQRACFTSPACQPGAVDACPKCRVADHYVELLAALKALVEMYGPSTDYADAAAIVWADAEDAIAKADLQ